MQNRRSTGLRAGRPRVSRPPGAEQIILSARRGPAALRKVVETDLTSVVGRGDDSHALPIVERAVQLVRNRHDLLGPTDK